VLIPVLSPGPSVGLSGGLWENGLLDLDVVWDNGLTGSEDEAGS